MSTIIRLDQNGRIVGQNKGIDLSTPGKLSIGGVPIDISPKDARKIGAGDVGLHVEITYPRSHRIIDVIGEGVKLRAWKPEKDALGLVAPIYDEKGGRALAYWLMGRKWPANAMPVMSLKDDSIFAATGMPKDKALVALAGAMKEWQRGTSGKIFNPIPALTTTANWKYDKINNIAFTPYVVGCSALAATGCWYKTQGIPAGTMYPILESDMTFNSRLKWTAIGETGKFDFQSVALHELGHTLGLGDLYNRAAFRADTRQVMHYYTGKKWTLGNGDVNGLWRLYG